MSIWGDADANEIPDDPFKIEPNWYRAIAVECFEKELDAAEAHSQLVIKWKIKQPGNRFDGLPVPDKNSYYKRKNDELDGEQIQRNSFLKMKLRQGLDLKPDEISVFNPKMALGKEAMIEVTNNPDKSNPEVIYNNVRAVLSLRLYNERFDAVPLEESELLSDLDV